MNVHRALISGVAVYAWAAVAWAGIPVPDVLLYGSVFFDNTVLTKDSDVTIVARVDGVAQPVGAYHMGNVYAAGDMYALRIRMESGADGSAQSANAARVGQTVKIYAKKGSDPEQLLTTFALSQGGLVQRLNLPPGRPTVKPDFDQDWDVDEDDFAAFEACASGPGVPRSSGCEGKDFDLDNDVDQADFSLFQRCYSGEHVEANLSCDD